MFESDGIFRGAWSRVNRDRERQAHDRPTAGRAPRGSPRPGDPVRPGRGDHNALVRSTLDEQLKLALAGKPKRATRRDLERRLSEAESVLDALIGKLAGCAVGGPAA